MRKSCLKYSTDETYIQKMTTKHQHFLSITHNLNKTVHKSIVQGTITDEADNTAIPKYLQLCDNERIAH